MYTGLIQAIGTVESLQTTLTGARLEVNRGSWDFDPAQGDSVCISGCCLTLVSSSDNGRVFRFDVIPESLEKTMIGSLKPGSKINLEHPVSASTLMGGHSVQGHVDTVGTVASVQSEGEYRVRIDLPSDLMKFMIPKGSVTIDGISLTLAAISPAENWIEVTLIPETLERTTLGEKAAGDRVNIEADIMVKTIVHTMEQMQLTLQQPSE